MQHLKSDKPQTKLGILNMAVEVIMQLEQQVRGEINEDGVIGDIGSQPFFFLASRTESKS